MDKRNNELMKLKSYNEGVDKELTMILQYLQWDRKHLLQKPAMIPCRYDSNHKIPPDKSEEHEKECYLRQHGYTKDDQLLPDPFDLNSNTLVKLKKEEIELIIANASRSDVSFKKVYRKVVGDSEPPHLFSIGCRGAEALSLERLQASYSADERRAIHDAVVSAVPSCHDLTDLALLSGDETKSSKVILSRMEILLELRNMRRRRTKYRVAAKSRNYSAVLRDVIKTQMEHFNDGKGEMDPKVTMDRPNNEKHNERRHSLQTTKEYRHDGKVVPRPIVIKTETEDSIERHVAEKSRKYEISNKDRNDGHRDRHDHEGNRSRHDHDRHRDRHDHDRRKDRSREIRSYDDTERNQKHGEHSRKRTHYYDLEEDGHRDSTKEKRYYYEGSKEKRKDRLGKERSKHHRHEDFDVSRVKKEPGHDEEPSFKESYREKRRKGYEHDDRYYDDSKHIAGSEERCNIRIKQERESVTRDDKTLEDRDKRHGKRKHDKKSDKKRHDKKKKKRDKHYDDYSSEGTEKYDRYYDTASEEIYDPNKKIKTEK